MGLICTAAQKSQSQMLPFEPPAYMAVEAWAAGFILCFAVLSPLFLSCLQKVLLTMQREDPFLSLRGKKCKCGAILDKINLYGEIFQQCCFLLGVIMCTPRSDIISKSKISPCSNKIIKYKHIVTSLPGLMMDTLGRVTCRVEAAGGPVGPCPLFCLLISLLQGPFPCQEPRVSQLREKFKHRKQFIVK